MESDSTVLSHWIDQLWEAKLGLKKLNGTIHKRVKVQGWKSKKIVLAEGQRIHYNFVKLH